MKRFVLVLLLLSLLSFISCSEGGEKLSLSETKEEKKTENIAPTQEERYLYDLSEYVTLPDPYGVVATFDDPGVCTEKELEEAILQIRLRLATYSEQIALVEEYSKVSVDYTVLLRGREIPEEGARGAELIVGMESEDGLENTLAKSLVGFGTGNQCYAEYTFPKSVVYDELSGQTVVIRAVIGEIYRAALPEFNEEFVRSLEGYETYSMKEFKDKLKKDILEQKEVNQRLAVWEAFCEGVTVHGYPEKELEEYRSDYLAYYTSLAEGMKMDLETLLSEYMEMTPEEFEEEKESYAEEMVKNDMIFTQLARTLEITLTDEEYRQGAERYFAAEEMDFDSVTEFIRYYTEPRIRENLIRDKAMMTVVENAVRAE